MNNFPIKTYDYSFGWVCLYTHVADPDFVATDLQVLSIFHDNSGMWWPFEEEV